MRRVSLPVVTAAPQMAARQAYADAIDPNEATGALRDAEARSITYVRISVTDRCNYRCGYCMPKDAATPSAFAARADLLQFEEIATLVTTFAAMGVTKIRLTGGEPLVRADIEQLVAMLAPLVPRVVMTTNGHLLAQKASALAAAGLRGVNVSLDTLDPVAFAEVTGGGDVAAVIAGIDAALAAGLTVKLNAVLDSPARLAEAADLCEFAWERGISPRFIEKMPLSAGAFVTSAPFVSAAGLRQQLTAAFGKLEPQTPRLGDDGPARYWQMASSPTHAFGVISAISDHFCATCNRVRVTATGALHTCLGYDDAVDLRALLRGGDPALVRRAIHAAVAQKRVGHIFGDDGTGGPQKHMIAMGG
ncbi:MAG: GTP 3',8-cyclase MoaA [Myxococcales bacterium]|nr:GTP 3',8-cyclase MoaA [Myxococcales bacterium]